jgi:outer membrane receptor protein involved in Fe transport
MINFLNVRECLRSGVAAVALCAGVSAGQALAQVQPEPGTDATARGIADEKGENETIVVTGSRIARPMLDSPVPVTVQTAADLFRTGATNVGDKLQQLPSFTPNYTQAGSLGGGNQIGTAGLDILNLRNLGESRTLVLVDGKRHITSIEGEFLVDINSIPNDLIDRVDVVTGGNSGVYGSDAMAGVVNFILKKNFQGINLNAQGGITTHGDRGTYKLSGTIGKNFADDRGNIALAVEYDRANPLSYVDRDKITGAFSGRNQFQLVNEPGSGVPERTFLRGVHSFGYADGGAFIAYNGGSVRACGDIAAACLPNGFPRVFLFQPNGDLAETNYGTDFRPVGSGNNQGGGGATLNNTGVLDPGLRRYVANLVGHFDFSDAFQPYVDAKFVRVISTQVSSPSFSQGGPQGTDSDGILQDPVNYLTFTPISLDNAFLTPQSRSLIQSLLPAGATFFNLNRNNVDLGSRGEHNRRDTYRIVVGARGTFNADWNYDVSVSYGKLKTKYIFTNNRIEQNFYNSIDAVFNGAGDIVCRINQTTVTDPACHPIDLLGFGGQAQTAAQRQAALNYFSTTSYRWGKATELDINASVAGDTSQFFNLPGGPIRFALGGEYRRETASYHYDDLVTSGATFFNAINPFTPPSFAVKEAFGEIDIPIIKDKPFFNELSLSGSGRYADYKGSTGQVWAYNGAVVYSPIPDIRFRANYSHSVRAPTLGDLYSPNSQDFRSIDDPCDTNFISSGTSFRAANCAAAGVPAGYVNNLARAGTLEILSGGNPNLSAEQSRSWTYGVVIQPKPVPGLAVSVDYYDIKISNVINAVDSQDIINGCYDAPTLNNSFCNLIFPRAPNGDLQSPALIESVLNFSALRAKGIDVDVSYNHRFNEDNRIAIRFIGSWVRDRTDFPYLDSPTQPDQVKGELGSPVYRFNFQTDYTYKKFTLGYTLRYIGRQSIADWEMQHTVAGEPDTPFDPDYADVVYYPRVIYHDINFNLDVNDRFSFYGGVNNVADKSPPYGLLGLGGGGVDGTGTDAIYDNIGRFMYLGVRVKM